MIPEWSIVGFAGHRELATPDVVAAQIGAALDRLAALCGSLATISSSASGADMLYTDVWVSMGKEAEAKERIQTLTGYQINADLVKLAKKDALVMHCLPAYRGKEIDEETLEAHADTIFEEAENRLHVQKAILNWAVS